MGQATENPNATTIQQPAPPTPPAEAEAENNDEDYEEPFEISDYTQLKGDVLASAQVLAKMTKLSPQSIRGFLVNDLYPMLVHVMDVTESYVMDLHGRVWNLEHDEGGGPGLSEEDGKRLLEYLARTSNIFQHLVQWAVQTGVQLPQEFLDEMQQLSVQLPSIIVIVQEAIESEEDEDEEEGDEIDEDDMIEPGAVNNAGDSAPASQPAPTAPTTEEANPEVAVEPQPQPQEPEPEPEPTVAPAPESQPVEEAKPEEPTS
jgi:hypothetical protein